VQQAAVHDGVQQEVSAGEWVALKAEQTRLALRVEALEAQLQRLQHDLGLNSSE
jgi:hypothetical protein